MNAQALRMFFFRVHTWLGLNTCILLGVMFATGTLLVFSTEMETAFYAKTKSGDLPQGQVLSYGQVFDAVQGAYPDVQIASISRTSTGSIFGDRTQAHTAWGEKISIWTDPGTGQILGASPAEGFHTILLSFHDSLFSGNWFGRTGVTVLAFSLLFSLVSGLIAYRRFWRGLKTLPPRGRGPRPWWGGLHRMVAVWCLPFLLVVAVTGIYYFVAQMGVLSTKGPKIPAAAERGSVLPPDFNGAALDQAIAAAQKAAPDQNVSAIFLPGHPSQGININGPYGPSVISIDTHRVVVDPLTMSVLAHITPADFSPKNKAKHFFDSVHHGDWAGNYSRVAWLLFGAAGTLLMFSGAMVFASRVARLPRPGSTTPDSINAFRRLWRGMFVLKWGLVLIAIAAAGAGIYRYGVQDKGWVRVAATDQYQPPVKLWSHGMLRAGKPLKLRLHVSDPAATLAKITFGASTFDVPLTAGKSGMTAQFQVTAGESRNAVEVVLPSIDGGKAIHTWILGRSIW